MNHIEKKGKADSSTVHDSERKIPKVSLPWLGGNEDPVNMNYLDYSRRISPSNVTKVMCTIKEIFRVQASIEDIMHLDC